MQTAYGYRARRGIGHAIAIALAYWAVVQTASAQAAGEKYTISIASVILAEPGVETPLPIQIAPGDKLPKNSFIRIRGLPPTVTLSEGHVIAAGSWAVPLSALPTLRLAAPISGSGKSQLTVALVGIDGSVWAEVKSALAVVPASSIAVGEKPAPQQTTVATVGPAGAPPPQPPASDPITQAAPPRPAPLSPEDNERALGFVEKGNEMIEQGDVAGARLFYERAVELGLAKAALALAETYDPNELSRWRVRGLKPDTAEARRWYQHALELGAPEANDRLRRLSSR